MAEIIARQRGKGFLSYITTWLLSYIRVVARAYVLAAVEWVIG